MASRTNAGSVTGTSTDGAWVRSRGRVEEAPVNGRLTRLLGEARWIVGALFGLALLAMLITYSKADPSFTHAVAGAKVSNLGGRVGAWVADIALLLFGLSAYLLVFGLAVWVARGFRVLHRNASGADPLNDELPGWAHALGYVLLLAGAVGLEALRLSSVGASLPGTPGGVIGGLIAQ